MKYDFSNLNMSTKKKAKSSNWLKPYDTAMLDFDRRYRAVKKVYVDFQEKLPYFGIQLEDAGRDASDKNEKAKVEKLIGAIMKLDFYEIGKSKPWSDLIDSIKDYHGNDLIDELESCNEEARDLKEILNEIVEFIYDLKILLSKDH